MNVILRFALENDSITDDEDFIEYALLVAFPRKKKTFLQRPNHFTKWRNEQFLQRFRLSKNTVRLILDHIRDNIVSKTDRNYAISPEEKLLLTLRYYATGSFLAVCGDFVGVSKSSASKIIRQVSHELALLKPLYLNMPETEEEINFIRQEFFDVIGFPKCIAAIDCTHVRIKSPGGDEAEVYRNRKSYFSINVQTLCDARLRIQNIVCRWPGSTHDATIFNHSAIKGRLERGEFGDSVVVGDSGYPLKKFLMTPFRNVTTDGQNLFNEAQIRTRNAVERCYGVWKRRFPILAVGINVHLDVVESIIVATAVLHNIACHFGESMPRVSERLERTIRLDIEEEREQGEHMNEEDGEVPLLRTVRNESDEGIDRRNAFVAYFERLQ